MASTDEANCRPYSVSEYHFIDEKAECVSFQLLPLQWSDGERQGGEKAKIFLHGTADNGFQIICKHVVAWKFDISSEEPEILVLSEGNSWNKLGKPRKSFEDTVRSILVTVHCIHYVKRNPEKSGESVWSHLSEVFRLYAVTPSQRDLVDHMPLIADCVNRYRGLAESKFLAKLFEEKTMKRKLSDDDTDARKKLKLIIDDIKDDKIDDADDEDNDNLFGEVCALCDDGGKIICCEGGCLRSFHATVEAGAGSYCKSLGFMPDDVVGMQNFYCKNCEHKQHQCFVCGKLGSSDKSAGAVEVVSCVAPNCGRFYHPHCVAILLNQDNGVPAEELERKIAGGDSFTCPIHKCFSCKQGENKKDSELQFAVCMRCPKSYHRKCLPREIAFENQGEMVEGRSITRAWDGLLPNRILIYCTKHDIDIEIGTVRRDHIKFPDVNQSTSTLKKKKTILEEKWKPISEFLVGRDRVVSKRNISLENSHGAKNARTKKPFVQKKKTRELMSDEKPVSKNSNSSSEESGGKISDPVLSKLVKQKLSSVKKKKTNLKQKTIVEKKEDSTVSVDRNEAVLKRRVPSSEGLFRAGSAPTVSKQKQKPSFVEEKNNKLVTENKIVEETRTLTSESLVDKETTVSEKKNPPLTSGIDISRMVKQKSSLKKELQTSMCEKTKTSLRDQHPNPSKSRLHCVHGNGQIQSNIPDDAGRRCPTCRYEPCSRFTSHWSGNETGCKRENLEKAYSNGMKQKQETEFDVACIIEKQDPIFSSNNIAGQKSVYDHIRTFSSTFYSHIGPVDDSLSSINTLATPSDATKLVSPTALDRCMGFALGPHLNYSLQNSAGWIDE